MSDTKKIVDSLKKYFKKNGFKKAVVGLSGGVDSALTAKLGVMALGKENITGIMMPNEGFSSGHSVTDSVKWAKELGIQYHIVPIKSLTKNYEKFAWKASKEAQMNLQARIRMTILYHYANSHDALVLGTGNKSELRLGYFTKHGDGAADILPIGNVYKTDVWKMAEELGLPLSILHKTPSAELKKNHSDEKEIGMSYPKIDVFLKKWEKGEKAKSSSEKDLEKRIMMNAHKNQPPSIM